MKRIANHVPRNHIGCLIFSMTIIIGFKMDWKPWEKKDGNWLQCNWQVIHIVKASMCIHRIFIFSRDLWAVESRCKYEFGWTTVFLVQKLSSPPHWHRFPAPFPRHTLTNTKKERLPFGSLSFFFLPTSSSSPHTPLPHRAWTQPAADREVINGYWSG